MEHICKAREKLNESHQITESIISRIAGALGTLGMESASNDLYECIQELRRGYNEIDTAIGKDIIKITNDMNQSSINMFHGALAAVAIQSGDPKTIDSVEKIIGSNSNNEEELGDLDV